MKNLITTIFVLFIILSTYAQDTIMADKIIARVGDDIVLQSEIEEQYLQMVSQRMQTDKNTKCEILESLLFHKLLLNQADLDSIFVTNSDVENEVEQRLQIFIDQAGSVTELEQHLGKSIFEIRKGLFDIMKEQLRAQKVQMTLSENMKITPSEVNEYYETIDKNSLPIIDETLELQVITIEPQITKEQADYTIKKMEKWKNQIETGEKQFETIALVYSEDESSAGDGGQLPFMARGELVPEFASVAFKLKKGQISDVVKTDFGYHIIRLDERKGERIKVSHILVSPKANASSRIDAKKRLDSILNVIKLDSISFTDAALKFSDDKETKKNGGLYFNPSTGSTQIEVSILPRNISKQISDTEIGGYTKVIETRDALGKVSYNIYKIKSRTNKHNASVSTDYQLIHNMALQSKNEEIIDSWIEEKQKTTYIHIDAKYLKCDFKTKGWIK